MRRALPIVALPLLVLVVLLLVRDGDPVDPEPTASPWPEVPRPAVNLDRRAPPPEEPAPLEEPPEGTAEPVVLKVELGDLRNRSYQTHNIWMFQPSRFWPLPEEDPLSGQAAARALQLLLDLEVGGEWERGRDEQAAFVELVDAGPTGELTPDQEDWWRLLRAEAARRVALSTWMEEMDALGEEFGPEEIPEEFPSEDYSGVRRLVEELIAERPDEPVADFARLYLLETVGALSSSEYDPDEAVAAAFSVMAASSDATVAEGALYLLGNLEEDRPLTREELALITREYELLGADRPRYPLASYGLTQAFALGDWEAAERWLARLEVALEAASDRTRRNYELDLATARGQLAAARGVVPDDWRARLVADAWSCHLEHPAAPERTVRSRGSWDEGWAWSGLVRLPPGFVGCFEEATAEHPEPGATAVTLALSGAR